MSCFARTAFTKCQEMIPSKLSKSDQALQFVIKKNWRLAYINNVNTNDFCYYT